MVDAEFSTDASVLTAAPASAAKMKPRIPLGMRCRTSSGYAMSGLVISAANNWWAMIPGNTTPTGTSSQSAAAKMIPICPSRSDRAASVRCMMNWLRPQ